MTVFFYDPPKFSAEFLRRMRKHPNITQMPSPRQLLTIPQLLLARYMRKGKRLSADDYIEISVSSSFPSNQELAREVAFQILFPNHTFQDLKLLLEGKSIEEINHLYEETISFSDENSEYQIIQKLSQEIKIVKNIDFKKERKKEEFFDYLYKNKDKHPFKSAIGFLNNYSEIFEYRIESLDELLDHIKAIIIQKINKLEPFELIAINNLSLNHIVETNTRKYWELFAIKALYNTNNIDIIISEIKQKKFRISDLTKIVKYLRNINTLNIEQNLQLNAIISQNIKTIEDLSLASFELNEVLKYDLEDLLASSFYITPLNKNLKLAKQLDQAFGTDFRSYFFKFLNDEIKNSNQVLMDNINNGLLELINQYSIATNSWTQFFQNIVEIRVLKAKNSFKAYNEFKILTHLIVSLAHSNENIYCAHFISQLIPQLVKNAFHSCIVPSELKDVVEFFKNLNLVFDKKDIKIVGKKVGMSQDEIFELIESDYEILKLLMSKPQNDLKKINELIKKVKKDIDFEKILELMKLALDSNNVAGMANLAALNLEQSLEAAKKIRGKIGIEKVISSLSATDGESLIKQWFLHRDKIPNIFKKKIKDTAKKVLVDLGINYSKTYMGSLSSGINQTNLIRPYVIGDELDDVDFEASICNILENGKRVNEVTYDDLYVFINSSGLRSICIELDVSDSMRGEKLAYMAICVTMLVYGLRKEELGIILFEKDNYVLKELDQLIEIELLADELLEIRAKGTTFVKKALIWAQDQFKRAFRTSRKINLMFTDADIYDLPNAAESLRSFKSLGVEFILICPEKKYNAMQSEKMIKLAGGQLIEVDNWESFPEKLTAIINARF